MTARPEGRGRHIARLGLILFYAVAGVGHLVFTDAMVRIVPGWVPQPRLFVLATGVAELAGAAGLLSVHTRRAAGWALAAYALCVWPANVQHAIIDLGSGRGLPIAYHAPRLMLQPLIIWWALWASGAWPLRRRGARH
ncbi:hypothetical protein F1C10_02465 [Sphingomonas sp. NBWT7]|nr:hypothetical protein F1C10_02465 [Sphingomonas sp. NBWT7]